VRIEIELDLFQRDPDRTERATPRRRRRAREEGRVAYSRDLNLSFAFLSAILALYFAMKLIYMSMINSFTYFFGFPAEAEVSIGSFMNQIKGLLKGFAVPMGIAFLIPVGVSLLVGFIQTRFLFAPKVLRLDFSRLNPVQGFRRMFSLRSLVEFLKNMVKLMILGIVAYTVLKGEWNNLILMPLLPLEESSLKMMNILFQVGLRCGIALLALGSADYLYQRWEYEKSIMMTRQEVKEEYKEVEGNPEVKRRQRQLMMEIMRRRMIQRVPEATVVITNPTHIAVALKYEVESMEAPVLIAKGAGDTAKRIVEIAKESDVPIVRNPPVARMIYETTEIGDEIPESLYRAVAEIIAYVYTLKGVRV